MRGLTKGLLLALLQVLLVASLAGKLHYDRSNMPRVWVRTIPADPNLPIRGRYVRMTLEVDYVGEKPDHRVGISLSVENDHLVARLVEPFGPLSVGWVESGEEEVSVLFPPTPFFIPEHVPDPSVLNPGEELWAEVTVPGKGPPRPIRLGVKKDGKIAPLDLR
jgi:hypothetical protein